MAFVRAATALAASAALSSPILLCSALGLTATAAAVSPSLGSTTTPASSLEAYTSADLLSAPWIRTDGPVVQSMLYSAPWTRSGPAGPGEPLGSSSCTAKTGSPTTGMIASCTAERYPVARGLESDDLLLSATPLVCPSASSPEEEEEEQEVGGMLGTAPWTKNVEERTELSAICQVRCPICRRYVGVCTRSIESTSYCAVRRRRGACLRGLVEPRHARRTHASYHEQRAHTHT